MRDVVAAGIMMMGVRDTRLAGLDGASTTGGGATDRAFGAGVTDFLAVAPSCGVRCE